MSLAFLTEIPSALFMYSHRILRTPAASSKPLSSRELYGVYEQDGRKFPGLRRERGTTA